MHSRCAADMLLAPAIRRCAKGKIADQRMLPCVTRQEVNSIIADASGAASIVIHASATMGVHQLSRMSGAYVDCVQMAVAWRQPLAVRRFMREWQLRTVVRTSRSSSDHLRENGNSSDYCTGAWGCTPHLCLYLALYRTLKRELALPALPPVLRSMQCAGRKMRRGVGAPVEIRYPVSATNNATSECMSSCAVIKYMLW